MTWLAIVIFILSVTLGGIYGWLNQFSGFQMVIAAGVSGFLGSCVIALGFTWLYFTQAESDEEKIQRLTDEIDRLRKEKEIQ
jgi:uncharacterized membrane protein